MLQSTIIPIQEQCGSCDHFRKYNGNSNKVMTRAKSCSKSRPIYTGEKNDKKLCQISQTLAL